MPWRHWTIFASVLVVVAASAACGGDDDASSSDGSTNPLTGLSGTPSGPVIGVKIDDTTAGMPQEGISEADVVYVEVVEGGLTRLLGIYASNRPNEVGPVRSVRSGDAQLLAQYGPIALAFSGGAAGQLDSFRESNLVDASSDAIPSEYERVTGRSAPYNLFVDVAALSEDVPDAAGVRDIGLHFADNDERVDSARGVSSVSVQMGAQPVDFAWDDDAQRWVRTVNNQRQTDAAGEDIATTNVIVQFCEVTTDPSQVDQAGNPVVTAQTVGSGEAMVFRDGKVLEGSWSRPNTDSPTTFTDSTGGEIPMRPGNSYILLTPAGSSVTMQ